MHIIICYLHNDLCLPTRTNISHAPCLVPYTTTLPDSRGNRGSCPRHIASTLDLSWHHKSTNGYLDIQAVLRPVLTSTKGSAGEPEKMSLCLESKEYSPCSSIFFFLFRHSLSFFHTVITPALPSIARGVAGQNHSLIWICSVHEQKRRSTLTVSVETLGCKQPAPVCSSWDKKVRKPHLGD